MLRVAVGAPGYGLDGFRQTRVQAERTQDLALAARAGGRGTTFADVGAIALICADIDAARSWVWGTLADLAVDDESHARLRNTLQVFLRAGTYTATAEQLALHKNSVQYRIRKAEDALGGRIEDRSADLELACEPANSSGRRYSSRWAPDPVGRARHSAGIQVNTDPVCALITYTTERRTDVR
jgi:DNA-binding PucR family transcriptional regulator